MGKRSNGTRSITPTQAAQTRMLGGGQIVKPQMG